MQKAIPSTKPGKLVSWKCNRCSIFTCQKCSIKVSWRTRNNKCSRALGYCPECHKKKVRKEYCPICLQFWSYDKKESDYSMIECGGCKMWVHRICDYTLTEEEFANYENGLNGEYSCMLCRQNKRREYLLKIIRIAEDKDKDRWFQEEYDKEDYRRIIKTPMYFSRMKEKIDQYLVNAELFKNDFNLIFQNAFDYNKPKDRPYKEAEKIQEYMSDLLKRKKEGLERRQMESIEEQEHQKWVRECIKKDPNFLETSEYISSAMSERLKKRKAMRYVDEDQSSFSKEEYKSKAYSDTRRISSRISHGQKSKNPEYDFTSDEEIEEFKKQTKFDLKKLGEYPYKAKHLLEKPEELEDLDIKQYYDNPVRC